MSNIVLFEFNITEVVRINRSCWKPEAGLIEDTERTSSNGLPEWVLVSVRLEVGSALELGPIDPLTWKL